MQYRDVIVFDNLRFHRAHEDTKTAFSDISTLGSVFEKLRFVYLWTKANPQKSCVFRRRSIRVNEAFIAE